MKLYLYVTLAIS